MSTDVTQKCTRTNKQACKHPLLLTPIGFDLTKSLNFVINIKLMFWNDTGLTIF